MTKTELENCIREYGKDIYSFCRNITVNLQEADDLYQDTFLKAIELGSKIDAKKNPKSYLLSIALRLWKNKKRKYAWRNRIEHDLDMEEASYFTPEHEFLKKEETDQVRKAANRLPEKLKIPVLLFYMEDLPVSQIAFVLKIPVGTVKSRLYQARKLLEKELEVVFDEKYG